MLLFSLRPYAGQVYSPASVATMERLSNQVPGSDQEDVADLDGAQTLLEEVPTSQVTPVCPCTDALAALPEAGEASAAAGQSGGERAPRERGRSRSRIQRFVADLPRPEQQYTEEEISEKCNKLAQMKFRTLLPRLEDAVQEAWNLACQAPPGQLLTEKAKVINKYLHKEGARWKTRPELFTARHSTSRTATKFNKQYSHGGWLAKPALCFFILSLLVL